ncbi:MAG: preprotein translocase subunit SecE [SAR202 cluster bacterium]|nr:preprotein translocase subunit SecE [SAR202 cluster bacterium]
MARVSPRPSRPATPRALGNANPIVFLQETVAELRKSVWPTREETARLTLVVIAVSVAMGFYLGGLDRALAGVFARFIL